MGKRKGRERGRDGDWEKRWVSGIEKNGISIRETGKKKESKDWERERRGE